MTRVPDVVFVVDVKEEKTAIREAQKIGIPIVALVDTNVNPQGITYPIPGNDDATKSVHIICEAIAGAIDEGMKIFESTKTTAASTQPLAESPPVQEEPASKKSEHLNVVAADQKGVVP
jgi:small subunit ribosomal protein S2